MANVTIRSNVAFTIPISLRREHAGLEGRTIYLRPRTVLEAPAEVAEEPEVLQYARKGAITVTGARPESREDAAPEKKRGKRKRKKED